ncbi:MAG TPA: redoxin domain-containing protein [Candidatus Micrarchaeia archaeon]|nr:redoxin domain-containing protein [Candidatus Micrarchaeia archaeon]
MGRQLTTPGSAPPAHRGRRPPRGALVAGAGLLVLIAAAGGWWAAGRHPAPARRGTVLVVATVARPVPTHAQIGLEPTGLALHPAGRPWAGGWRRAAVRVGTVALPGQAVAPGETSLVQLRVPVGRYDGVALSWRDTPAGRVATTRRHALVVVGRTGLTPVLVTLRLAAEGSAPVAVTAAYGGNTALNFGLQVAAGTVLAAPTLKLVGAAGRTASLRDYRGQVVVLASFLTQCQESCPLVDAALLQVWQAIRRRGLTSRVRVVMVTQEPQVDTPAAVARYARHFGLPFTLLTGGVATVDRFWRELHIPPGVNAPIRGRGPVDPFTGRRATTNPLHPSAVIVIDPRGEVVSTLLGQPTIRGGVPTVVARYLDAQGRAELRAGGSWSPATVTRSVLGLLQSEGVGAAFPKPAGARTVARVGSLAPPFTLRSSAGGWTSLVGLRGHPVILDFWATWCINCRRELPLLDRTARRDRGHGLRLILVNYQQGRATATAYLRRLGVRRPTLLDPQGAVAARYGAVALPVNVFLTAGGRVAGIQVGQLSPATLSAQLRPILPRSGAAAPG